MSEINRRPVVLNTDPVNRESVLIRPRGEGIDLPPYKDKEGRWRTKTLFLETFDRSMWEWYTPIFTLGEFDFPMTASNTGWYERYEADPKIPERHPIPSLRRIYLSYSDPSEYKFSVEVFKSTYHWKHLCKCKWFQPYLEEWRLTLGEKLRQIGMEVLVGIAQGSDPKLAMPAAKWLAEQGWKERKGKGRPSDQAVEQEVKRESEIERIYREDAERLGIEVQAEGPDSPVQGVPGPGSDSFN
jgi:hypothetical protein